MNPDDIKAEKNTNVDVATRFEIMAPLPRTLQGTQCVIHNHEILICGGSGERGCYSYHTLKNTYKRICSYPNDVELFGHCVVKYVNNDNPNGITLLSFGGPENEKKHTLMMKYVSIWDVDSEIDNANIECYNTWNHLTDNQNKAISIGRSESDYEGVRAVVGGSNNHLLFITYFPNNIDVFNLITLQYINHATLPIDPEYPICYHCFISMAENGSSIVNLNKDITIMWLFCYEKGLRIEYNEDTNTFGFHSIRVCTTIRSFYSYACVCVNDFILFFGGDDGAEIDALKDMYKYSITEDKWVKFEYSLPFPLTDCVATLNDNNMYVHIIGGYDGDDAVSTHIRTKVDNWMKEETEFEKKWLIEEEEKREIEDIKIELEEMQEGDDIYKLKRRKEIKIITEYWVRSLFIKFGWIHEFDVIISKYILMKYFKPLKIFRGHDDILCSVKFSPDDTKLVTTSYDKTIRIWDVKSGKEIHILRGHTGPVYAAQFSPDGKTVVSCSLDKTIRLWDTETGTETRKIEEHTKSVTNTEFSPDGKTIVSSSYDQTIRIWDVKSGKEKSRFEGHSNAVNDVQFSPDGQLIVSSSLDNTIAIWDVKSGEQKKILKGHTNWVMRAKFFPDNRLVVSCSADGTIRVWDAILGTQLKKLCGHFDVVIDVQFFPDGQSLMSCSMDETIRLWDIKLGMEIQILKGHEQEVAGVDISTYSNTIVSCSNDGTVRLWGQL
ncbi:WD-40 repeat protein [Reticulomyxa filosa]|uniref:WD-40 repeat protein n=1 Tax=Reticulomyxa filosa TaxID=46433 RepID=X6NDW4_RETFI|nr:WD-40 repeat protein [Reticulomyxa filosa]|eukprot:ETO23919.1 WD-40 repeat protein [Reticulomyxa filosa]